MIIKSKKQNTKAFRYLILKIQNKTIKKKKLKLTELANKEKTAIHKKVSIATKQQRILKMKEKKT